MNKINKFERIRQITLAAELEAVQKELTTVETQLASLTLTVNRIISRLIEDGGFDIEN